MIEVAFDLTLAGGDHQVVPQVELAALVQEGSLYVRLHNVSAYAAVGVSLLFLYGVLDLL